MERRIQSFASQYRRAIVTGSVVLLAVIAALTYFALRGSGPTAVQGGQGLQRANAAGLGIETDGSGLRLCNRTGNRVGVAVGYKQDRDWTTEGWWNIAAGNCSTLVAGALLSRFYYIYAVDYDAGGVWGGNAQMCTRDKIFTIKGIQDCVARGYESSGFFEVDTGEQKSWTVQLMEPDGQEVGIGG